MNLKQKYDVSFEQDFQNYLESVSELLNEEALKFKELSITEEDFDDIIFDLEDSYEKGMTPFAAVKDLYRKRFNLYLECLN